MIQGQEYRVLTKNDKKEEKILRQKSASFDFNKFSKKEINELIKKMREEMIKANGIGLAANQIGLDYRLFIARIPEIRVNQRSNPRKSASYKFYAIFNPEIIRTSKEKITLEEGCLSVPGGIYGEVERPSKITLVGFDKNGKKIKIKAWGLLARVFQHEVDHLNGIIYIDKAKNVRKVVSSK